MRIPLSPKIYDISIQLVAFCEKVQNQIQKATPEEKNHIIQNLRLEIKENLLLSTSEQITFACMQSLILDLIGQNWKLEIDNNTVYVSLPNLEDYTPVEIKEHIRQGHLVERNSQLREKSVTEFVRKMERRRLTKQGWHSVFSLMRDGSELYDRIQSLGVNLELTTNEAIKWDEVISPYIQFVDSDSVCVHTGFKLIDIWRYFRLTWVNVYKSVPGRSINILIRDASAPNHPIIGIAALGSSVVQQAVRDEWIGWNKKTFLEDIQATLTNETAEWLLTSINELIDDIYTDDLKNIFSETDICTPTEELIEKLKAEATACMIQHRLYPQLSYHKGSSVNSVKSDWEKQTKTNLFRAKRCKTLASILTIRKTFQDFGFYSASASELGQALKSAKVRNALGQVCRQIKGKHVGINMMDITVCGAVAPYNHLLGGKLVCMLLCSPEVTQYFREKYKDRESIIASSMKGAPVLREPNLVLLCTTSLYGVGSSQYNRIKIPNELFGELESEPIRYKEIGSSEGFGSSHLSNDTIFFMDILLARSNKGRRVNSIFGEGVNPLMRKIRDGLDLLGLPSDKILRHGNQRIVYGISLARNFKDVLLGRCSKPQYYLPQENANAISKKIADYWIDRWLVNRVKKNEVLLSVRQHTLSYPVKHGARIPFYNFESNDTYVMWHEN